MSNKLKLYTINDIQELSLNEILEALNSKQAKIHYAKKEFERFAKIADNPKKSIDNEILQCSLINIDLLNENEFEYIKDDIGQESIRFKDGLSEHLQKKYGENYHLLREMI